MQAPSITLDLQSTRADPCVTLLRDAGSPSARIYARMLDLVDYGLVFVVAGEHVAFANRVARRELATDHPLRLTDETLGARDPKDLVQLRSALVGAWHKGLQRLLTLDDGSGEPVTIAVVPIGEPTAQPVGAMLIFGKRKVCEELSADAFARQHRLTHAESRVLKELCEGTRPTDIAAVQGVALSTVRTHIGCIREKVGAPSIGALVRRVARLPPLASLLRA